MCFHFCQIKQENFTGLFFSRSRTRQFESASFTYSTFSNFSPSFFSYLDLPISPETLLRSFELKLVGYMRQLSDDLDLIDNTTHLLSVWSYMIEGLTDTIFSCSNHYHIKIIDQYFAILKLTFDSIGHRFSIYLICCVIIPWLQSFVCSNFLKLTSSLRKLAIFRRHAQRQNSTFMNLTAWRLFLGNLLEHILYIFEMSKEFEEYHQILFDCFQSMLIDWLCVANEYVGRLGLSCLKHFLNHISTKFDQTLRSTCIDNLQHALLLTSLPTEYLIYEFLLSSSDDLLRNVRIYLLNDLNSSAGANGDQSIFPLCQQIFNENSQQQKIPECKFFRFTFRTANDNEPHEIQMKTFVYLNYFHLQLIYLVGELNWPEFVPCFCQTIDLAERFDSTLSNFGLRCILQQLFTFDPPAVTFQHVKRIAFQYLIDYLMIGVKNDLVKQSIESANSNSENNEQNNKNTDEYMSFPETPSPKIRLAGTVEKETGFFGRFATYLNDSTYNSVDLLKMLSDGIADLLFSGSNRLETHSEVIEIKSNICFSFNFIFEIQLDQTGLYLLRADTDLIDKFVPSTTAHPANLRRFSICENETEYFIVNQEMISRVLNDHKILRKIDAQNTPPQTRNKSSAPSTPSPSTHQRFFSQSLFNETIKTNT